MPSSEIMISYEQLHRCNQCGAPITEINPKTKKLYKCCRNCIAKRKAIQDERVKNGLCRLCGQPKSPNHKSRCEKCAKRDNKQRHSARKELTNKFLSMYNNGKCFCCGEANPLFLTLDHKQNDGWKYRQDRKQRGDWSLRELRRATENYLPNEFQVACYNCNMGRARNGGICPHQDKKIESQV